MIPCLCLNVVPLAAVEVFAERLRRQVCETFIAVDNAWTELGHLAGTGCRCPPNSIAAANLAQWLCYGGIKDSVP